jgi:hypothetical protein
MVFKKSLFKDMRKNNQLQDSCLFQSSQVELKSVKKFDPSECNTFDYTKTESDFRNITVSQDLENNISILFIIYLSFI